VSKYRRAAKVDLNQSDIVKDLRMMGVSVEVGHDDILCGYKGKTYWYEIKSENATSRKTGEVLESSKKDDQKRLEKEFKGHYRIITCLADITMELFGVSE